MEEERRDKEEYEIEQQKLKEEIDGNGVIDGKIYCDYCITYIYMYSYHEWVYMHQFDSFTNQPYWNGNEAAPANTASGM